MRYRVAASAPGRGTHVAEADRIQDGVAQALDALDEEVLVEDLLDSFTEITIDIRLTLAEARRVLRRQ